MVSGSGTRHQGTKAKGKRKKAKHKRARHAVPLRLFTFCLLPYSLSLAQPLAHAVAEHLAVNGFSFQARLGRFDYGAHLLGGVGVRFGDGRFDRLLELRIAGSSGQIAFDDSNFLGFFISQVGAPAAAELLDRFSTLLDQGLQHLERLGILEWADLLDFLVLERSLEHAEHTQTELCLGYHGLSLVYLDAHIQ